MLNITCKKKHTEELGFGQITPQSTIHGCKTHKNISVKRNFQHLVHCVIYKTVSGAPTVLSWWVIPKYVSETRNLIEKSLFITSVPFCLFWAQYMNSQVSKYNLHLHFISKQCCNTRDMMSVGRDSRLSAGSACTGPSLSDRPCVEYSLQRPRALPHSLAALAPGNMTSACSEWCQEKDTTALWVKTGTSFHTNEKMKWIRQRRAGEIQYKLWEKKQGQPSTLNNYGEEWGTNLFCSGTVINSHSFRRKSNFRKRSKREQKKTWVWRPAFYRYYHTICRKYTQDFCKIFCYHIAKQISHEGCWKNVMLDFIT